MNWVEVRDASSGELLLPSVRRCTSFTCRLRGLTFRRSLGEDEGLLLVGGRESRIDTAIHMLFVFFRITVVWLDAGGRVVDMRLASPFQLVCLPSARARDILEGPADLIDRVRVGQELCFPERLDA